MVLVIMMLNCLLILSQIYCENSLYRPVCYCNRLDTPLTPFAYNKANKVKHLTVLTPIKSNQLPLNDTTAESLLILRHKLKTQCFQRDLIMMQQNLLFLLFVLDVFL